MTNSTTKRATRISLGITPDTSAALDLLATRTGFSKQSLIREMVAFYLEHRIASITAGVTLTVSDTNKLRGLVERLQRVVDGANGQNYGQNATELASTNAQNATQTLATSTKPPVSPKLAAIIASLDEDDPDEFGEK